MNNKSSLESSKLAGCYCCVKTFDAKEISNYTDKSTTALCPFCSCDCVIGDSVTKIDNETLQQAKKIWIGG